MKSLIYCPTCWPADLGQRDERQRCKLCGTTCMHATPEKHIELLQEQNEALADSLGEAQEMLKRLLDVREAPAGRLLHLVAQPEGARP